MSTRPRIRSIKPEAWQDEKVGSLSRDARLLMIGLITMADDEGRLRALPSVILGHVFPWDEIQPRKLAAWLNEIAQSGLVVLYENDGKPYVAFRHWRRHQVINKPTPSVLPPPPDPVVVRENSSPNYGSATGGLREESGSDLCSPARADRKGREGNGRDQGGEGNARPPADHEFVLEQIELPGGDLARLDGSAFVQRRIDGAVGGWLRDHVPDDLHADDGILLVRAMLKHRIRVTRKKVLEVDEVARGVAADHPANAPEWVVDVACRRHSLATTTTAEVPAA